MCLFVHMLHLQMCLRLHVQHPSRSMMQRWTPRIGFFPAVAVLSGLEGGRGVLYLRDATLLLQSPPLSN